MRPEEDMLLQLREHDLPPSWDGRPCTWDTWRAHTPAFICPPPKPSCCEGCGSMAAAVTNRALVDGVWRLTAHRCPDCRLDVVWDHETGEWWTLDHTDYGVDGSVAPS